MGQNQNSSSPNRFYGIKVTKCWVTRKETSSFTVDKQTLYFESSIGIGVESDNPEHTSRDLYNGAHASLNILFERERQNWLSAKLAVAEHDRMTKELTDILVERNAATISASAAVSASAPISIPASAAVSDPDAVPKPLQATPEF